MKGFFKNRPSTPLELVGATRELLTSLDFSKPPRGDRKRGHMLAELTRILREIKVILYGVTGSRERAQLTREILRGNTIRLMIESIPHMDLEAKKDTSQVLANVQRQSVSSRFIGGDYLEKNMDLMDLLITGYENPEISLPYGTVLRVSIRYQTVARYLLDAGSWKKLMKYIQLPNFEVASDALATFELLMTRHKSTVAEYLRESYDSFFDEYNSQLLECPEYFPRRQSIHLLGDILLDRSNISTMLRYISSTENLVRIMRLLTDPSKRIQIEAFHVFKLFVAYTNKSEDTLSILAANREKLLRLLRELSTGTEDDKFKEENVRIITEIKCLSYIRDQ